MPSLEQIVRQLNEDAAKAAADGASEQLPDPADDPWCYLDLEEGEDRMRRWCARQEAGKPARKRPQSKS
jgi:hypothetical protein